MDHEQLIPKIHLIDEEIRTCGLCEGSGACPLCEGYGSMDQDGCGACGGAETCAECGGSGEVTDHVYGY